MSTIRKTKSSQFAAISRELLQNSALGFDTRGLLGYLLSKPAEWEIQASDIEREGAIGRDVRRRLMKEAELAGYLTFYTERDAQGRIRSGYELHEIPVPENQRTRQLAQATGGGFSVVGSAAVGSAAVGKPTPLENREVQNKELENKEGKKPPVERVTISDALEEVFPGHATNIKTMNDLCALVLRMAASPEQVLAFPEWLSHSYPMKALSPFSFKDQFPQFVKQNGVVTNGQNKPRETHNNRAAKQTLNLIAELTGTSGGGDSYPAKSSFLELTPPRG